MMGRYGDGWGWGAWLGMSLMMVVFWGALVALVVVLVRSSRHPFGGPAAPPDEARRILDERLARGEVSEEDYLKRRELLSRR